MKPATFASSLQNASPQPLVLSGNLQAPAPLHVPAHTLGICSPAPPSGTLMPASGSTAPMFGAAIPVHSIAGSVPSGIGLQTPSLPGTLHAMQPPTQAFSQQTPSTQDPEAHSVLAEQTSPLATVLPMSMPASESV